MRARSTLLIAFPVLLLALLAGERTAVVLLGAYPADPELWRVWLSLRALIGNFWVQTDFWLGTSLALQWCGLAVAAILCGLLARVRTPVAIPFLLNHVTLLLVVVMLATGNHARTASILSDLPGLGVYMLPAGLAFNWLAGTVLAFGICACGYCHYLFLQDARCRKRAVAFTLLLVERDL